MHIKMIEAAEMITVEREELRRANVHMAGGPGGGYRIKRDREVKMVSIERGQYPAIFTEKAWSMEDLLFGFRGNFYRGTQPVVPSEQDSSLPARVANHYSCPLTELAI